MQSPSTATLRPAKRWTRPRRAWRSKAGGIASHATTSRARGSKARLDPASGRLLACSAMPVSVVPCGKDDIEVVRALISHPSLQGEYAMLVHPGVLEDSWGDPYADFELRWLALVDGAPAGYLFTL